jgi:alpha-1,6-mannosyltransferase
MRFITRFRLLIALGLLSFIPYLHALQLQDLRQHTVEFEYAFFAAFGLYALAVLLVLRDNQSTSSLVPPGLPFDKLRAGSPVAIPNSCYTLRVPRMPPTPCGTYSASRDVPSAGQLAAIFTFAILFRALLVFNPPTLSDDMYRYVWDGRVQAQHLSPYAYPPASPELANLRDGAIYPHINRPDVVPVYPAGAEWVYALIWRIVPDNVRWFQIVMASGDLLAGLLLVLLLRALHRPVQLVLIYLWSPLVLFETAHAAHIDGLVLPLLVGAWLARVKGRDGSVGALLGGAAALKLYPALLLPALFRWRDDQGRLRPAWQMPLAFAVTFFLPYLPYLAQGGRVVGFLPEYFDERFNMGLAGVITHYLEAPPNPFFYEIAEISGGNFQHVTNALLLGSLVLTGLMLGLRPAVSGEQAVRRSIWIIGAFTLFTQNLFPWYMLWLVPLLALFVQPGRLGFKLNAWTGWFLFSGLVALAYTFFIIWQPVAWVPWVEFGPLYAFLLIPAAWKTVKQVTTRRPPLASSLRTAPRDL